MGNENYNQNNPIDYCKGAIEKRVVSRTEGLAEKLFLDEDLGPITQFERAKLEAEATRDELKYSCKDPNSALLKKDNPFELPLDPYGKFKEKGIEWAYKKVKQGLKNIGDGLNKFNGIKAPSKEQMNNFRNAQAGTNPQSTLLNTAKEAQKQKFNKQWKEYYDKNSNQQSSVPAKNTGLSNSDKVADKLLPKPDLTQITYPDYPTPEVSGIGAIIGNMVGSFASLALGVVASGLIPTSNAYPTGLFNGDTGAPIGFKLHTGGIVPGNGEVASILMGGETVRTEAQEKELQQLLLKNHMETYAPIVCGENNQQTEDKKQTNEAKNQNNKPIHQQITKDDEAFILTLISDALQRNRMGLRNLVKAI